MADVLRRVVRGNEQEEGKSAQSGVPLSLRCPTLWDPSAVGKGWLQGWGQILAPHHRLGNSGRFLGKGRARTEPPSTAGLGPGVLPYKHPRMPLLPSPMATSSRLLFPHRYFPPGAYHRWD